MSENESNPRGPSVTTPSSAGVQATNDIQNVSLQLGEVALKSSGEARIVSDGELQAMFLEAGSGETGAADSFFNRFSYVQALWEGDYSLALEGGMTLLTKCKKIDPGVYERIHKGTPFYWLGMAAFLVNDYETATFFFDAAVSQDIRAGTQPLGQSSPALRFIQVEGKQPGQAAQRLVLALQVRIEDAIADYNSRDRPLGISDLELLHIRQSFFTPALTRGRANWRSLATTFISYFLEWDYRARLLDLRVGDGTAEPFFLHLFKGCVLFESLLKANPKNVPTGSTLGQVLN